MIGNNSNNFVKILKRTYLTWIRPHSFGPTLFPPNPGPKQPRIPHFPDRTPLSTGNRVHVHKKYRYNRLFSGNTRFWGRLVLRNSGLSAGAKKGRQGRSSETPIGRRKGVVWRFLEKRDSGFFQGKWLNFLTFKNAPTDDRPGLGWIPGRVAFVKDFKKKLNTAPQDQVRTAVHPPVHRFLPCARPSP